MKQVKIDQNMQDIMYVGSVRYLIHCINYMRKGFRYILIPIDDVA